MSPVNISEVLFRYSQGVQSHLEYFAVGSCEPDHCSTITNMLAANIKSHLNNVRALTNKMRLLLLDQLSEQRACSVKVSCTKITRISRIVVQTGANLAAL